MPLSPFRAMTVAILSLCIASCSAASSSGPQPTRLPTGEYACGGIARLPCPQGKECQDIPEDSCDPAQGGRDCGGVCVDRTDEAPAADAPKGCASPDPQKKKYVGNSSDECARIRFVCDAGTQYFSDDCGCGCRR